MDEGCLDLPKLLRIAACFLEKVFLGYISCGAVTRVEVPQIVLIDGRRFGARRLFRKLTAACDQDPPVMFNLAGRECHFRLSKSRVYNISRTLRILRLKTGR